MSATERIWRTQYDDVCRNLQQRGAVRRLEDGFEYVDCDAAGELLDTYNSLRTIGFAHGWF